MISYSQFGFTRPPVPILFLGKALNNSGDFLFLGKEFCDSSVTPVWDSQTLTLYSPKAQQLENLYISDLQIEKTFVLGLLHGSNTNMELLVR